MQRQINIKIYFVWEFFHNFQVHSKRGEGWQKINIQDFQLCKVYALSNKKGSSYNQSHQEAEE